MTAPTVIGDLDHLLAAGRDKADWQADLASREAETSGHLDRAAAHTDAVGVCARAVNEAILAAEALYAAEGRAYRMALASVATSNIMDMPRRNLRHLLLLYAATTREPMLRQWLPWARERARQGARCYRVALEGERV